MKLQIGLMAKHWTPNATKTRLAASIGPRLAAECSKQLLLATHERLSQFGTSRRLLFTPSHQAAAFAPFAHQGWSLEPQPEGDLGERMEWFFQSALAEGNDAALLLGSDSPDFPATAIEAGIKWLSRPSAKLVLGPSSDGGYWMIGMKGSVAPLLEGMPWSTPTLLDATLQRLEALGWKQGEEYALLDKWYDVDTVDDLRRLEARLREGSLSERGLGALRQYLEQLDL